MSSGNLNTYGGKKNNFPFQHNLLLINSAISAAVAAGATEATLQLVLTALQSGQEYEAKLVRDSDTPPVNWLEVRIFNTTTGNFDPPVYYLAGSNTVGSPVLPIVYIDPTTLLATIASNTTGLNLEATQLLIKTVLDTIKVDTAKLDVALSTRAAEVTLVATNALLTTIDAVLDAIKVDTGNMLTSLATEATLLDVETAIDAVKLDTANLDVALSTRASELTLSALLTELQLKADLTETQPVSQAGVSRTPSVVVAVGDASTVAGKQEVSLYFRGAGGTLGGGAVPSGFEKTFSAKLGDTVGAIAYTVPTAGAQEVIITYLT